jgi:hypothetical protein
MAYMDPAPHPQPQPPPPPPLPHVDAKAKYMFSTSVMYDSAPTSNHQLNPISTNNNVNNNTNGANPPPIPKYGKSSFNIQDDDDGHLIYVPGDVLKNRCNKL